MVASHNIEEVIRDSMPRYSPLVGCTRRNVWSKGHIKHDWRKSRGVALLNLAGTIIEVDTHTGPFDIFTHGKHMIVFRGGPWNLHWAKDIVHEWTLAKDQFDWLDSEVLVLHEEKGALDIKSIIVPTEENYTKQLKELKERDPFTEPPPRMEKSSPYNIRVCRFCPYKTRCDATDALQEETHDYAPNYPLP